jgi:hypothetical protein
VLRVIRGDEAAAATVSGDEPCSNATAWVQLEAEPAGLLRRVHLPGEAVALASSAFEIPAAPARQVLFVAEAGAKCVTSWSASRSRCG